MKAKTIILHIGPHKTGTTYIQKYLFLNRKILEEYGIYYPIPKCLNEKVGHFGHHDILSNIDYYIESSSVHNIILLSSETISTFKNEQLETLLDSFSRHNIKKIKILAFIRNPFYRLKSLYVESVKWGDTKTFPHFIIEHLSKPFQSEALNPSIIFDKFSSLIGKENIILIDYDYFFKNENILNPVFEVINVPLDKIYLKKERVNKSLDEIKVEIIRILNFLAKEDKLLKFNNVREVFLQYIGNDNTNFKVVFNKLNSEANKYKAEINIGDFYLKLIKNNFIKEWENNIYKNIISDWNTNKTFYFIEEGFGFKNNYILEKMYNTFIKPKINNK